MERPVGELLRDWRQRRRLSQMALALEAEVSTRHLSFVESGRSLPSREMVLRLSKQLDVPLRERNQLLVAAGFAPVFAARSLDDPALREARKAMELILKAHEPFPALAVDRYWNLASANAAVSPILASIDASLLTPPINVLRLSLHPLGLAPRIVNAREWGNNLLARLRRDVEVTGDPTLAALLEELLRYPLPPGADGASEPQVVIPFELRHQDQVLRFISTTTLFGTPVEVTLSELAIESFFPADEATAAFLRGV